MILWSDGKRSVFLLRGKIFGRTRQKRNKIFQMLDNDVSSE